MAAREVRFQILQSTEEHEAFKAGAENDGFENLAMWFRKLAKDRIADQAAESAKLPRRAAGRKR